MRHHLQAFDVLEMLFRRSGETANLDHVDAHADLGLGDYSFAYLLGDWFSQRHTVHGPDRGHHELNSGNWLAFAIASGFVESTLHIRSPTSSSDFVRHYFREDPYQASEIIFRQFEKATFRHPSGWNNSTDYWQHLRSLDSRTEDVVRAGWRVAQQAEYERRSRPDFVMVCQSPQFTPIEADAIIFQLQDYVSADNVGVELLAPISS
jgi:hypothetical protein